MNVRALKNAAARGALVGLVWLGFAREAHADKPDARGSKIGVYIHMINAWSNPLADSRKHYFEVVDRKLGVTCKESNIRALETAPFGYSDMSLKDLPKFRTALKKAPKLDSDAAATKMLDAMAEILAVDDRVTHYFSNSKFDGDDCKRGKEIQATLFAAWPKFFEGEKEVRAVVEKYSDEQALVKLAEAEKKFGKSSFHWYQRRLLIDAKALIDVVDRIDRDKPSDPAPLREKAATLQKDLDELTPLYRKFAARDDAGDTGMWSYLLAYVKDYLQAADGVARRMDDDLKRKSVGTYTISEMKALIPLYNKVIDASNKSTFSKPMK